MIVPYVFKNVNVEEMILIHVPVSYTARLNAQPPVMVSTRRRFQ
jgi:hypothetical protein